MASRNFYVIKFKYENRALSLKDVFDFTTQRLITEDEFHFITTYNYQAIKEDRGW